MVKVAIWGSLRTATDGKAEVEADPGTFKQILDQLVVDYPGLEPQIKRGVSFALDGKIYQRGMLDFKQDIALQLDVLDYLNDPEATDRAEQLTAMDISCDAVILFAERHADLAVEKANSEKNPERRSEDFCKC